MTAWVTGLAQVGFGIALDLGQDHGRDLGRGIFLVIHLDPHIAVLGRQDRIGDARQGALHFRVLILAAHEAFDGKNGVLRIDDGLVAGHPSHQAFVVLVDRHHGRHQPLPFRGGDDDRFGAHHDRPDRVGGSQVNSNDFDS